MYNIVVNGVIFNNEGKILIAQRASKDDHEPGMWTTPGGTVEDGDEEFNIVEATLQREIMEEVGVTIKPSILPITNNTFTKNDGTKVLALVYLCEYKSGEARPLDEMDSIAWVDISKLDQYAFPPNVRDYIEIGHKAYLSIKAANV